MSSDADYVIAFDDSGGIEPLVKWGGKFIEGDQPICVLTHVLIKSDCLIEFEEDWFNLRSEIKKTLNSEYLPPIHLRIMYGKHLPHVYRGKPNPYLGCEFQQIVEWLAKAFAIGQKYSFRKYSMGHWFNVSVRSESKEKIENYFSKPHFQAELKFLKEHSKGPRKKMAAKYLNKAWSPLLPMWSSALLYIDTVMAYLSHRGFVNAKIQVDPFSDAHGIDATEVFKAINEIVQLKNIAGIEIVNDGDDSALLQLADLYGFLRFRSSMYEKGFIKEDKVLSSIYRKFRLKDFMYANHETLMNKRFSIQDRFTNKSTIHYATARQVIEKADSDFADKYMVDVHTFLKRCVEVWGTDDGGISILKNPDVCKHLITPLNGEDRG